MKRLNIVPAPAFQELRNELFTQLEKAGSSLRADRFGALLDPLTEAVFRQGIQHAGGAEGTIWVADEAGEFLVPAHNSGPRAQEIVGQFKQPIGSGLICLVFASEQPFLENDVARNSQQSKLLDNLLNVHTTALIAVPFYFLRQCRGVISCVQLSSSGQNGGFHPQDLACVQQLAEVLSRLIDFQFLSTEVGWNR
ncbi:MAG TPA: GAF domain-containing protein [Candidatus Acidoferrales bacterium]|nr:GAF domain-containing protein [Candidatus Acidoferrales bacterium]